MPRPLKHVDWQLVHSLALKGVPLSQLARQFNVGYPAVLTRAKREEWNVSTRPWRALNPVSTEADSKRFNDQLALANRQLALLSAETQTNAAIILHKFFANYANASPDKVRKDSLHISRLLRSAVDCFGWNVGKLPASQPLPNIPGLHLQVLEMRPQAENPDSLSGQSADSPSAIAPESVESGDSADLPGS